jgi:glycosyltransferase involved in cell wall biosynthesis
MRTAIVIPALDAERTVGEVVAGAARVLPDVLVVDDGASDRTSEAARAAGARVLRHPVNRGTGAALRTAFDDLFARGFEAVVTLDADGQHLPGEIPVLLGAGAEGADLVLGTRAHLFSAMSRVRSASNRLSSGAISIVAGERIPDVQSGFRLYRRRLIEAVGFDEPRFEAESAVLVRAVRGGFRVAAVPIRLGFADGRACSHYRPIVDSLRIAGAVARARLGRGARAPLAEPGKDNVPIEDPPRPVSVPEDRR